MFPRFKQAVASTILCVCGWLSITSSMAAGTSDLTSSAGAAAIARSSKAALQGNGRLAAASLLAVPRNHFGGKDITYRRCMLRRFGADSVAPRRPDTGDPFVSSVLELYQTYWWRALMSPTERDTAGKRLRYDLSMLLGEPETIEDWDWLDARIAAKLRELGYYSQLGKTPPLRELMIWRTQKSSLHEVTLPEGSYPVQLELLDDFVTRGWSAYARCERSSNGGWATRERLYAVGPAFPHGIDSDSFRASLLGHETQHFADFTRFPELTSWELEYRAKLTELWLSKDSLGFLLGRFARDQCDDRQAPHLFANQRVMRDLRDYLSMHGTTTSRSDLVDVAPDKLRAAARAVLMQDTRTREHSASVAATRHENR